ncbi:MAG: Fic family protein [Culicoidibacterales bacterium]
MHYQSLKNLYYRLSPDEFHAEYQKRLTGYGSFTTNLSITPIQKGQFSSQSELPLFIVHIPELFQLNEQIIAFSHKIETLANELPNLAKTQYLNHLLINELQSTNEIEQVRSTKKELTAILNQQAPKNQKRFVGLVQMYQSFTQTEHFQLDAVADFRTIYDQLVADDVTDDDQLDGLLFRKESVTVMASTRALHRGLTPETKIIEYLNHLILFMRDETVPILYRIMLMHYFFEYIHPFYDGNGRVGRYLLFQFLAQELDNFSAISLAYTINKQKATYYEIFELTSHPHNQGEATFFCLQMLDFLATGQQNILNDLTEKKQQMRNIEQTIQDLIDLGTLTIEQGEILNVFAQFRRFAPEDSSFSQIQLAQSLPYSRRKLDMIANELYQKGMLEKAQQKPLIYTMSTNYLNLLSQR